VKLTPKKVRRLIRQREGDMSSNDVAIAPKVTPRRVNQVWEMYLDVGETPIIGARIGRPRTFVITETERFVIKEAK